MAQRRKLYRTMQGRMVDIEKLRSANESVQAVGNMNVNARAVSYTHLTLPTKREV